MMSLLFVSTDETWQHFQDCLDRLNLGGGCENASINVAAARDQFARLSAVQQKEARQLLRSPDYRSASQLIAL